MREGRTLLREFQFLSLSIWDGTSTWTLRKSESQRRFSHLPKDRVFLMLLERTVLHLQQSRRTGFWVLLELRRVCWLSRLVRMW